MSEMVVPDGWEVKRLGEIGEFSTSSVNKKSLPNEETVCLLNYMDVYRNSFLDEDYLFQQVTAPTKQIISSSVRKGDVFFTPSSETPDDIGHSTVFLGNKVNLVHSYHTIRFRLNQEDIFDDHFKAYAFKTFSTYEYFRKRATGSTRFTISLPVFNELEVTIPPLPEQQKIASILTSVDEVIEKTQSQINKLQDLKEGTMNELLTKGIGHTEFKDSPVGKIPVEWEVLETSSLYKFKNGLNKEKDAFGTGQKIVNYMDVYKRPELSDFDLIGRVELSTSESERFSVSLGDVFFTRTSETPDEIGLSSVITNVSENVCFSGFILRGRPVTTKLLSGLSGYMYRCDYIRKQIVRTCSYTTRALTNGTSLGQVVVAIPTIEEQEKIYILIKSIENLIYQSQRKLQQTQSLKKSLMQDLLTGKVRVTVN